MKYLQKKLCFSYDYRNEYLLYQKQALIIRLHSGPRFQDSFSPKKRTGVSFLKPSQIPFIQNPKTNCSAKSNPLLRMQLFIL